jgi:hypothetical protein
LSNFRGSDVISLLAIAVNPKLVKSRLISPYLLVVTMLAPLLIRQVDAPIKLDVLGVLLVDN